MKDYIEINSKYTRAFYVTIEEYSLTDWLNVYDKDKNYLNSIFNKGQVTKQQLLDWLEKNTNYKKINY